MRKSPKAKKYKRRVKSLEIKQPTAGINKILVPYGKLKSQSESRTKKTHHTQIVINIIITTVEKIAEVTNSVDWIE
jgi:hypothetical protein